MEQKISGRWLAVVGLLLLGALATPAWANPLPVGGCGTLGGPQSYILTTDVGGPGNVVPPGTACLIIKGNGVTLDLNGHSIRGDLSGVVGSGSTGILGSPGNNVTIKGPGIIHDFDTCVTLGTYALVEDVLVYGCWNGVGIQLGDASKCVECRVHDSKSTGFVVVSTTQGPLVSATPLTFTFVGGIGIVMGSGCLLESSIVEQSDNGAVVGQDCKVWDLVVDGIEHIGLRVGAGTSVARTVISHFHDGPGLDYRPCTGPPLGCQDSSNSVWSAIDPGAPTILDGVVITDCATNNSSVKYRPTAPPLQCP